MPQIVYTNTKIPVQFDDKPLASGGEGTVFRVKSAGVYTNTCVKIYHAPKRTAARRKKVAFMILNKPQVTSSPNFIICWPIESIFDSNQKFIGFLMPLAFQSSEQLYELTRPAISKRLQIGWGKFDRSTSTGIEKRLKVCVNIAIAIHSIHQSGKYALVDYKPQNILINSQGKISITDVDSFQIAENGVVLFHSEVSTPEYAPPESTKINSSQALIPEFWDRFSLAVSFYEILFGIHPFVATCGGQYSYVTTIGEMIQKGLFVHGSKRNYLTVIPTLHDNFKLMPESIKQLFIKAFEDGHTNSKLRPSAEQWGETINSELINKKIIGYPASIIQMTPVKPSTTGSKKTDIKPITPIPTLTGGSQTVSTPKNHHYFWKVVAVILLLVAFNNRVCRKLPSFLNDDTSISQTEADMHNRRESDLKNLISPLWIGKMGKESLAVKFKRLSEDKLQGNTTYRSSSYNFTGSMVLKNTSWVIQFTETGNKKDNLVFELIYDPVTSIISGSCNGKDPKIRDRVVLSILSNK